MRKLVPVLALAFSVSAFAADVDLKSNMKQMKMEFKHAAEATEVAEMQTAIENLSSLVQELKQADLPPEKSDVYVEGFTKLSQALDSVDAELEQGDLDGAKQALRNVDELREEYHDKRNPSIWSKLFG